ncbi:SDR family oxidoreductase [Streptomyces bambusae]|uniref:SDR family oxidoreductase n=1 Tax=Streptomyces bambusae TaxID=1550616 RepID=UPI001CFE16A4|nr:SDR family oxidoreductase [Streptomyces bambusae]MCB5164666.1 SDR family oxidoreductase [Streptomyces bambusae]
MRILVTGASGVVGTEVAERLAADAGPGGIVRTARRAAGGDSGPVPWNIGAEAAPEPLTGRPWDVIVHTAASTRWTMSRQEATDANIRTLRAVLGLAGPDTHVVHVSTAYVGGVRSAEDLRGEEFEGYRNGYEWSKAVCEEIVATEHRGPATIVRPPLVLGRRGDGLINRFSGPYSLFPALVTGLAAVAVGDPDGYAEIAPVDEVAEVIAQAALGTAPGAPRTEVISAGEDSMRLSDLVRITCETLNAFRAEHGVDPIAQPPTVSTDSWNRFFLPLAAQWLSPVQQEAVRLLAMFQSYTSMSRPFEPTHKVADPGGVMAAAVRHWAQSKPRQALGRTVPWTMINAA